MLEQIKVIDGVEYSKYSKEDKFLSTEDSGVNPGIICECGNTEFTLSYGKCELNAHCTKCGAMDTVYSG